jgi:hypothetical protein
MKPQRRLSVLALLLLGACPQTGGPGIGAPCDRADPCRSFLVCVEGSCRVPSAPPDGGDGASPEPDASPGETSRPDGGGGGLPPDPAEAYQIHVLGIAAGRLWHTSATYTSQPRNNWPQFLEARPPIEPPTAAILQIDAEALGSELVVLLRAADGAVLETSLSGQGWSRWSPLPWREVIAAGMARLDGRLEACALVGDGRLAVAARGPGQPWPPLAEMTSLVGPERFAHVDCAAAGGQLHLVALDGEGKAWYAGRHGEEWTPLRRLPAAGFLGFRDFDLAGLPGELHLVGTTREDRQLHGIRFNDGTDTGFQDHDVKTTPPAGPITATAATGVFDSLHVLRLVSGVVYHAVRANVIHTTRFGNLNQPGLAFTTVTLAGIVR